ncbi:MAG: hypothetical protein FWB81_04185 [Cystobacterineae bacterium]|nr:hypothetical protein [Cystobacterineae bacterium]
MEPKGALKRKRAGIATLTTTELKAGLNQAHSLEQPEENALRMLYGLGVDTQALLPKACANNEEVADELLLIEMQLFRAARMQQHPNGFARPSPQKRKIISALRAKK